MALSDGRNSPNSSCGTLGEDQALVDTALGLCLWRGKVLLLRLPSDNRWCPGCWDFLTTATTHGSGAEASLRHVLSQRIGASATVVRRYEPLIWSEDRYTVAWRLWPLLLKLEHPIAGVQGRYDDFVFVAPNRVNKFQDARYPYLTAVWRRVA